MCLSLDLSRTFGCEFETVSRNQYPLDSAARAVCKAYGLPTSVIYREHHLSARCIPLPDGRVWKVEHDGSLSHGGAEIVSPPLRLSEMDQLSRVLSALKSAGCEVDESCGCHTHVDAADLDAAALRRLVNLFAAKEDLTCTALAVSPARLMHYSAKLSDRFLFELNLHKPAKIEDLAVLWYGTPNWEYHADCHYDDSRYRTLNLHAFFEGFRGNRHPTVEFRLFEGTLDVAQAQANAMLALSMVELAKASKSASPRVSSSQIENPRYTFRCFLLRLGFIGDEFASARKVLLSNLPGDTAWLRGADAYESYHAQVAARRTA